MKISQAIFALLVIFIGIIFFVRCLIVLDPDFGFHIKTGEYILSHGIPKTDPFSYTMPSFPVIAHEWLSDLTWAFIFPIVGNSGLALFYALCSVLPLLIVIPKNKLNWAAIFPFILSSIILLFFVGIRPQVITWLFTAGLLKILLDANLWQKFKLFTPILFLLWANLHGGVAAGLGIFLISLLVNTWQKNLQKQDLGLFLLSLLVTLLNPYGVGLWREVFYTVTDPSLKASVVEWASILNYINLPFMLLFALSSTLIIRYRNSITPIQIILFAIFSLLTFSSSRYAPLWILITLPLTIQCFEKVYKEAKQNNSLDRFKYLAVLLFLISIFWLNNSAANLFFNPDILQEEALYPKQAINFLKQNRPEGQLFAPYHWGGYLIWRYPEKKVFIDGRMPSWKKYQAPDNESQNILQEYREIIVEGKNFQPTFDKFDIKTVLWPNPEKTTKNTYLENVYTNSFVAANNFFYPNQNPYPPDLSQRLKASGWQIIYQDQTAIILVNPH